MIHVIAALVLLTFSGVAAFTGYALGRRNGWDAGLKAGRPKPRPFTSDGVVAEVLKVGEAQDTNTVERWVRHRQMPQ